MSELGEIPRLEDEKNRYMERVSYLTQLIKDVDSYGIGSDVVAYCPRTIRDRWQAVCLGREE